MRNALAAFILIAMGVFVGNAVVAQVRRRPATGDVSPP